MENKNLIGFDPVKFIELLLKLDGRAKGFQVEVSVRKKNQTTSKACKESRAG